MFNKVLQNVISFINLALLASMVDSSHGKKASETSKQKSELVSWNQCPTKHDID